MIFSFPTRFRLFITRIQRWLTLEGHVKVRQPWGLALGPVILAIALAAPYRWLFFIAYTYIILSIASYFWIRTLGPRIELRRFMRSNWAEVGDQLEEQWDLYNHAWLPLLWIEIEDASTLPGYTARRVTGAGGHDHNRWLTNITCTRRGVHTLGPLTIRISDPSGVFTYERRIGESHQIIIYPPLVRLPPLPLPHGRRGGLAHADLLQQHVTPSVGGLREYVPGDVPSRIHWPSVARKQRLMVKEFDQERAGALWIALDLSATAYPDKPEPIAQPFDSQTTIYGQSSVVATVPLADYRDSPLELAIVLACSLAAHALGEGRSVGLLADDGQRRVVTPGQGPRQLWRIMGTLVDAQATGNLEIGEVLRQEHRGHVTGAALAIVTPALEGQWLPAVAAWQRGRPEGALALLIARPALRATGLAERLASAGIASQIFDLDQPLQLLNPPKTRTTLRISPLGRAIQS